MTIMSDRKKMISTQLIELQKLHKHRERYTVTLEVDENLKLKIDVFPRVFRPEVSDTSELLVHYLYETEKSFKNKKYLDMGCGSGIISLFLCKMGADVVAADINKSAVDCTQHNLRKNHYSTDAVLQSDLFESIDRDHSFDRIVFNPPFFEGKTDGTRPEENGWIGGINTIERFLKAAKNYLTVDGNIIFCAQEDIPDSRILDYVVRSLYYELISSSPRKVGDFDYIIHRLSFEKHQKMIRIYDTERPFHVFARYVQNDDLLRMLSKTIGNAEDDYHIDVGFTGRLSLFSCLSYNPHLLNPASKQLEQGRYILRDLVDCYEKLEISARKGKLKDNECRRHLSGVQWLADIPSAFQTKIFDELSRQFQIIGKSGKDLKNTESLQGLPVWFSRLYKPNITEYENVLPEMFDTASLVDLFPNIRYEVVDSTFRLLHYLLKPEGQAIFTFFPPRDDLEPSNEVFADDIYRKLAQEYEIDFSEMYSPYQKCVNLSKLNDAILEKNPEKYEDLRLRYWLDIEEFWLQKRGDITSACRFYGFNIQDERRVPGGMQNSMRMAFIIEKAQVRT